MNYTFEIISPKYGRFVVTAPECLREKLSAFRWYVRRSPHHAPGHEFAVLGNTSRTIGKRTLYLHKYIWELLGMPPCQAVDHKDRNPMNNAADNLRAATIQQNTWNSPRRRTNRSGYIGVSYNTRQRKWAAAVRKGRTYHCGFFATAEEAARARDAKARELHGEFVSLNFPSCADAPGMGKP